LFTGIKKGNPRSGEGGFFKGEGTIISKEALQEMQGDPKKGRGEGYMRESTPPAETGLR
jgi:hypothetical protein